MTHIKRIDEMFDDECTYAVQVFPQQKQNKKPSNMLKSVLKKIAKDFNAKLTVDFTILSISFTDEFQAKECLERVLNDAITYREAFSGFVVTGAQISPEHIFFDEEHPFNEF